MESSEARVVFIGRVAQVSDQLSRIEVLPRFKKGLSLLESFSHIIVLYWFHCRDTAVDRETLTVTPKRHIGAPEVGVFTSRSPSRPNPIGLCIVELVEIDEGTLVVKGLDALVGSPIVDIKPYIPRADSFLNARVPDWTLRGPAT